MILRSDGAEDFGVLSIAVSYPCPNEDKEANGAIADAMAALVMNERLEVGFDIVLIFCKPRITTNTIVELWLCLYEIISRYLLKQTNTLPVN